MVIREQREGSIRLADKGTVEPKEWMCDGERETGKGWWENNKAGGFH
jgi:hypothetical protein